MHFCWHELLLSQGSAEFVSSIAVYLFASPFEGQLHCHEDKAEKEQMMVSVHRLPHRMNSLQLLENHEKYLKNSASTETVLVTVR